MGPFRPVDTTTTCSENNTKKSKKPRLKSLPGGPSTKPTPSSEPKNSKKPRRSSPPNSKKWKNLLNPLKPNALLLKRPRSDNSVKSKISRSISNEPTPPPLLSTRNSETSTRSSPSTNRKKKNFKLSSKAPRRKPEA